MFYDWMINKVTVNKQTTQVQVLDWKATNVQTLKEVQTTRTIAQDQSKKLQEINFCPVLQYYVHGDKVTG